MSGLENTDAFSDAQKAAFELLQTNEDKLKFVYDTLSKGKDEWEDLWREDHAKLSDFSTENDRLKTELNKLKDRDISDPINNKNKLDGQGLINLRKELSMFLRGQEVCDGESPGALRAFLDKMREVRQWLPNVPDIELVKAIFQHSVGALSRKITNYVQVENNGKCNFYDLLAYIEKNFFSVDNKFYKRLELNNLYQTNYEKLASFIRRFEDVLNIAYDPTESKTPVVEELLVRTFIKGIALPNLRSQIYLKNPKTLKEAFAIALDVNRAYDLALNPLLSTYPGDQKPSKAVTWSDHEQGGSGYRPGETDMEIGVLSAAPSRVMDKGLSSHRDAQFEKKFSALFLEVSRLNKKIAMMEPSKDWQRQNSVPRKAIPPRQAVTSTPSKIRCFNCQKVGHIRRSCPDNKEQRKVSRHKVEKQIALLQDHLDDLNIVDTEDDSGGHHDILETISPLDHDDQIEFEDDPETC